MARMNENYIDGWPRAARKEERRGVTKSNTIRS